MNKDSIMNEAKTALQTIFEQYKDKGLISIYLWGSIISNDFNPETSDIDSIGLADDSFSYDYEKEIQEYLSKTSSNIKKFGFRILYKSEANGDEAKAFLSKVIPTPLLIHDSPSWKFLFGEKIEKFNFSTITFDRAIKIQLQEMENSYIPDDLTIEHGRMHFTKTLARLVDFAQGKRLPTVPFSYSLLRDNVTDELEQKVVTGIIETRKNKWDKTTFENYLPIFNEYINRLKKIK